MSGEVYEAFQVAKRHFLSATITIHSCRKQVLSVFKSMSAIVAVGDIIFEGLFFFGTTIFLCIALGIIINSLLITNFKE